MVLLLILNLFSGHQIKSRIESLDFASEIADTLRETADTAFRFRKISGKFAGTQLAAKTFTTSQYEVYTNCDIAQSS